MLARRRFHPIHGISYSAGRALSSERLPTQRASEVAELLPHRWGPSSIACSGRMHSSAPLVAPAHHYVF